MWVVGEGLFLLQKLAYFKRTYSRIALTSAVGKARRLEFGVWNPARLCWSPSSAPRCVALGKSLHLSQPQFPRLQTGQNDNTSFKGSCKD